MVLQDTPPKANLLTSRPLLQLQEELACRHPPPPNQRITMSDLLKWNLGLVSSTHKYLTAETFQFKVTANGTALKKKQIWTLEKVGDNVIALRSSLGRYLGTDKDGKTDGSYEAVGEETKFIIETQDDGKISLKNQAFGRYFGGSGDTLDCFRKDCSPDCLFIIHLAMHPQVNLYNVNRRAFAHLVEAEVRVNELIPWGADAMMTLEFHAGKYAIRAPDKQYVTRSGALAKDVSKDALFTLVFRNDQVAFRDCNGKYLTAVGAAAVLQSRKDTISKDELFSLQDSHSQVVLTSSKGKYVSVRGVIEVKANQSDVTDTEIFQLEAVDRTDFTGNTKWLVRGKDGKYWNDKASNIICDGTDPTDAHCQFELQWYGKEIALKASNGKFVAVKANGQLAPNADELNDSAKFVWKLINRPILVLRCEFGFVGPKGGSGVLECNRSMYEVYDVICNDGVFNLKAPNGKFVQVKADNTLTQNGEEGTNFFFELRAHSRVAIVAPNGHYLKSAQNGTFTADGGSNVNQNTLWEY